LITVGGVWRVTQSITLGPSATFVQSRLDLASAHLRQKNYPAALAAAEEILRTVPDQVDALRVRDEARAAIKRFDDLVASTRRSLTSGDLDAARGALDAARLIDPTAPSVVELSSQLARAQIPTLPGTAAAPKTGVRDGRSGAAAASAGGTGDTVAAEGAARAAGRGTEPRVAAALPPPGPIDAESWLATAAFTSLSHARRQQSFFATRIDGRAGQKDSEYRAQWKPLTGSCVADWWSGETEQQFKDRDAASLAKGFLPLTVTRFTDSSGAARYQSTWVKNCDATLAASMPGETAQLPPTASQTPWLSSADLNTLVKYQSNSGLLTIRIEGRMGAGRREFRAESAKRPASCVWYYAFDKTLAEYKQLDKDYQPSGFALLWMTQFVDASGVGRYQAVWTRNCAPY
jgi:hypothetical protein